MSREIVLSIAGVCNKNATRVRSYCKLIKNSLADNWLIADEFVQSHVSIVRSDYLKSWDKEKINKSQVIIVLTTIDNETVFGYNYQISSPITANKIKHVLNLVSKEVIFKKIVEQHKTNNKKPSALFKTVFSKMRKNIFGYNEKKVLQNKLNKRSSFINRLTNSFGQGRLIPYKIILLGSPGSGKTTSILSVSDNKALSSEVIASDSVAINKPKTTIGTDYARVSINNKELGNRDIELIGTPGQIKFNFIWDIVGKSADAFFILLDMSRPEPESYLQFYLRFLTRELGNNLNVFCALTHCENYSDKHTFIENIKNNYSKIKGVEVFDPRIKSSILNVLETLPIEKKTNKDLHST